MHISDQVMNVNYLAVFVLISISSCTGTSSNRASATSLDNRSTASEVPSMYVQGDWGFANHCGFGHYVGITFVQTGEKTVSGNWSDGTNLRGSSGELKGEIREGKLFVKFCSDDIENKPPYRICPEFDGDDAYFSLESSSLVWYESYGDSFKRYVVLSKGPDHSSTVGNNADCSNGPN